MLLKNSNTKTSAEANLTTISSIFCFHYQHFSTATTMAKTVFVNDKMQQQYSYTLTEPPGKNFHPDFKPQLTPADMLKLGVFGGRYMTDCRE